MRNLAGKFNEARAWSFEQNRMNNYSAGHLTSHDSSRSPIIVRDGQRVDTSMNEVRTHDAIVNIRRLDSNLSESQQSQSQSDCEMLGVEEVEEGKRTDNQTDGFVFPRRRRKGTKRIISPSDSSAKRTQLGGLSYSLAVTGMTKQNQQDIDQSKIKTVKPFQNQNMHVGRLAGSAELKASRSIQKKVVFFVGNVDAKYKFGDIVSYMKKNLGIACLSCYDLSLIDNNDDKPRISSNLVMKGRTEIRSKAFRVCIKAEDKQMFLDLNKWPKDITIRNWTFKPRVADLEKKSPIRREEASDKSPRIQGQSAEEDSNVIAASLRNVDSVPDRAFELWSDAIEVLDKGMQEIHAIVHASQDNDSEKHSENIVSEEPNICHGVDN